MASSSTGMDPVVQKVLRKNEFLELMEVGEGDNKRERVKCQLTGHEMLPRVDVIETHLKSKKFVKARDWYCHDYSQYEPYIVPHRRLSKSLFCNVTGTILNRIPSEVEKHVQGKRYKRMKQHVKITVKKSDDDDDDETQGNDEFNADEFEFANSQVIYSDAEEEEAVEEEVEVEGVKKEEEEDDMADLYPDDESDDEIKSDDKEEAKSDVKEEEVKAEKFTKKRSAKGKSTQKKTRHHSKKSKKSE